jgi:hypothetical protein
MMREVAGASPAANALSCFAPSRFASRPFGVDRFSNPISAVKRKR